jgi:hypothetical protein
LFRIVSCFLKQKRKQNGNPTFDDNLSVTHSFIKQIFRAIEVAPPFPLPPQGCAGGGVVVALLSHKPYHTRLEISILNK